MSTSTKSLLDVWMEYYEPHWTGKDEVSEIVKVSATVAEMSHCMFVSACGFLTNGIY